MGWIWSTSARSSVISCFSLLCCLCISLILHRHSNLRSCTLTFFWFVILAMPSPHVRLNWWCLLNDSLHCPIFVALASAEAREVSWFLFEILFPLTKEISLVTEIYKLSHLMESVRHIFLCLKTIFSSSRFLSTFRMSYEAQHQHGFGELSHLENWGNWQEPIKAQKNETTTYDWHPIKADTTTYDWQPFIAEIDAILFEERSETFMKKTVANLVSIFNMNCTEFASVLYRTFPKIIPSRWNDDKRFSSQNIVNTRYLCYIIIIF